MSTHDADTQAPTNPGPGEQILREYEDVTGDYRSLRQQAVPLSTERSFQRRIFELERKATNNILSEIKTFEDFHTIKLRILRSKSTRDNFHGDWLPTCQSNQDKLQLIIQQLEELLDNIRACPT
ncbi:hypothetical protein PanWU01x14_344990 [Parasponia andersonii]|uniref:Uncharacterized protein n=1 Tax=Parasponia andersonii TaxID=3476 RepID=A0A2P5ACU4_PARAD|nr:hypothetical protein PanWU01x14_344990 [Parasponia andersonii]